jgi:hypothetical protein
MATRTTANAVSEIVKVKSGDDLTPFIEAANSVVTKHCTDDAFTTAELELVERWLSAHFYLVYKPAGLIERAGPVSKQIESRVDLGFDVTRHGQMAMRLDWSGALSALNEQAKKGAAMSVGVDWLGTPVEEQEDDE